MALVRITPENAVDTVRQQLDSFADSVASAGRAPAILKLGEQAAELRELAASGCLEVDLLGLGGLHPSWSGVVAEWLGIEPEPLTKIEEEATIVELPTDLAKVVSVVRVRSQLDGAPRRAGMRVPPILVVASGRTEAPDKETLSKVLAQIQSRPLTLVLSPKDVAWAKALSGLGSREHFVCKPRDLEGLATAGATLEESLERPPWKQAGELAASWSIAGALASLYDAFSVALEKEDRAARAKKASVEQRSQQLQGAPMPTEILGEVRGIIQKKFDRFQKDVSRKLKDLVAPQEGTLWREIDVEAGKLERFDMVKKPKVDAVTIPDDFEQPLIDRIKEVLGRICHTSLVDLHDFLRDIKEEIERLIENRGGPPVVLHFQHLPKEQVEKVLNRSVVIQRPYKGEISRKGLMDIFMAARRYQMLFFMIFSAFGLSFIRSFTMFTVPAGLMLMSYGFLNVYVSFKQQRAEAEEKEMDKARDSLRGELSRAMAEVQKVWDQTISTFMTEQQNSALELVENAVRTSSAMGSRQAAGDKELVQQQIKSLDATQRKLAEGIKTSETAREDLGQIRSSLIEFFVSATTPPEVDAGAAAGATAGAAGAKLPGVPGAATGGAAASGGAAKTAEALKAQAAEKLAKLKGKSAGATKKPPSLASRAGASKLADKAKPSGARAAPAGGGAKSDPSKLKQQAQERLKALKEKAQAARAKASSRRAPEADDKKASASKVGAASKKVDTGPKKAKTPAKKEDRV